MLENKNILIIGARAGGYGEGIAKAAIRTGATVYCTTLSPDDPREKSFFDNLGAQLIDVPLRYDSDKRQKVFEACEEIAARLKASRSGPLHAVVHAVAGGFPRQPSVMKSVGDILKGKETFFDLATPVKRNVYYVNAQSFQDTVSGLRDICDETTHYVALTYRGELPYFIAHTKRYLERLAMRMAKEGKHTLVVALPEAWTQSSQFFAGIELAVIFNYWKCKESLGDIAPDAAGPFQSMEESLSQIQGWTETLDFLTGFLHENWKKIAQSENSPEMWNTVQDLFSRMRKDGRFPVMRKAVELISEFVRDVSGIVLLREFMEKGKYQPGDVRQVFFQDLMGANHINCAPPLPEKPVPPVINRTWVEYDKDEIRRTLPMYGENFLFLDKVIMETGGFRHGMMGFGKYTVPGPETNLILKDHFVGMPLFGGHLQMEAVAQLGTFMIMKLLKDRRLVPILTGTEFPDLNTMAPPGETLTMVGVIGFTDKRDLWFEAFIENRYARSKGIIRGMVLSERVVRKMTASFDLGVKPHEDES
jgi:3-hydroxymyristoyl/3-hydroxydecanoyl-(acyl carrier protein) dehydratase